MYHVPPNTKYVPGANSAEYAYQGIGIHVRYIYIYILYIFICMPLLHMYGGTSLSVCTYGCTKDGISVWKVGWKFCDQVQTRRLVRERPLSPNKDFLKR